MDTSFADLIVEDDVVRGAYATCAEGLIEIRATLVVGADGRHSKVRVKSGLRARNIGPTLRARRYRTDHDHDRSRRLLAMCLCDREGRVRDDQGRWNRSLPNANRAARAIYARSRRRAHGLEFDQLADGNGRSTAALVPRGTFVYRRLQRTRCHQSAASASASPFKTPSQRRMPSIPRFARTPHRSSPYAGSSAGECSPRSSFRRRKSRSRIASCSASCKVHVPCARR